MPQCSKNPLHVYHSHLRYCPWCEQEAQLQGLDIPLEKKSKTQPVQNPLPPANKAAGTPTSTSPPRPAPQPAPARRAPTVTHSGNQYKKTKTTSCWDELDYRKVGLACMVVSLIAVWPLLSWWRVERPSRTKPWHSASEFRRVREVSRLIIETHPRDVTGVLYKRNGSLIIYGSSERDAFIRYQDRPQTQRLTGHRAMVTSTAVSPDVRLLASASVDHTIRVWQLPTGRVLHVLKGHTASVEAVCFSPDGLSLASASRDNTVRVWDLKSGRTTQTFQSPIVKRPKTRFFNLAPDLAFVPQSSNKPNSWYIVSSSTFVSIGSTMVQYCAPINVHSVASGRTFYINEPGPCRLSPDGKLIVRSRPTGISSLWNDSDWCSAWRPVEIYVSQVLKRKPRPNYSIRLHQARTDILVGGEAFFSFGSQTSGYDWSTGRLVSRFDTPIGLGQPYALSPDGKILAGYTKHKVGYGYKLGLWDTASGALLRELESFKGTPWTQLWFSADGGSLMVLKSLDTKPESSQCVVYGGLPADT